MHLPGSAWAVVVAAGAGTRFGGPKQYELLGGRRVVDWALADARSHCDGVVLVVAAGAGTDEPGADAVVEGGATRSASVRAGLAAVPERAERIVVHDAARPFAGADLFAAVLAAVAAGADAAVPGVALADTVKETAADHRTGGSRRVVATVDRARLVAVQTPQAFTAAALRRAHTGGAEATDDAALVEADGGRVVVVPGHDRNRKLTTPADLVAARAILAAGTP